MKRKLALVLVVSLILSLGAFSTVSFAADNGEFIITTGEEFVEKVVADNFGSTFKINGTEDTDGDDVADGIILPSSYTYNKIQGFYGTITGVEGKNNIFISSTNSVFYSFGAGKTNISNLVLKGDVIKASGTSRHVGTLVDRIEDASADVTIENITNYVDVADNASTKCCIGGIVGNVKGASVTIRNCINNGDISASRQYIPAGGILGGSQGAKTIRIENCVNYGNITAEKSGSSTTSPAYLGGIYGSATNYSSTLADATPEEKIIITKCANYGNIKGETTGTGYYAAGIACFVFNGEISECFNAGNVMSSSRYASGICNQGEKGSSSIYNCFNTGVITNCNSSTTYALDESACGIAAANKSNKAGLVITYCYNVGDMSQRSDAKKDSTELTRAKQITNSTNSACDKNYCLEGAPSSQNEGSKDPIEITLEDLAKLPAPFDADPWEKNDDGTFYSLPQIKGNTFYAAEDDGWYIANTDPSAEFNNTQSFSPEDVNNEAYNKYGNYSVVLTKMNLTAIEDEEITEFGMYLLDGNGNRLAVAEGDEGKRIGGVFGILFYGNKFEDGVTYKAQPYIKAGTTEYTGAAVEFQIADAE